MNRPSRDQSMAVFDAWDDNNNVGSAVPSTGFS
jgi:hypothetical protein